MNHARNIAISVLLVLLGTIKMVADVFGLERLSGAAAVTNASPAMKVFTAHRGYETFSSKFHLTLTLRDGQQRTLWLTPKVYGNLKGPYNRRNVFGAALAYGPIFDADLRTRPMLHEVVQRGFCDSTDVFEELRIIDGPRLTVKSLRFDYVPREADVNSEFASTLEFNCE